MNKTKKILIVLNVVVVMFIISMGSFALGFSISNLATAKTSTKTPPSSQLTGLVREVQGILDNEALVPPKSSELTSATINGMLGSLNEKYALYFDKEQYKIFNEEESGSFSGVGIVMGENKEGRAYVTKVLPDAPAEKAGVKVGDVFISINGKTQDKWTTEEVMKLVRGKTGTKISLSFSRKGSKVPVDFTIVRQQIKIPNGENKLVGPNHNIGYIRLYQFTSGAADDIRAGIQKLSQAGAKSFILDLRENPGGLLQSSIDVTSLFVKSGVVVRVEERGKPQAVYSVTGITTTNAKLVVLVDEYSASASEIVSAALQDHKRAIIVGNTTFGKGSVQTVRPLSNGGAIKFTIAHYLSPNSRTINGKGVTPDVLVKMDIQKQSSVGTDTQLQRAIEILK